MNPDFTDAFSLQHDEYSVPASSFAIPDFCNAYQPSDQGDFTCVILLQPTPEKGAKEWTRYGQRILLGVFRDEGRPAQVPPPRTCQWIRTGDKLFVGVDRPHLLKVGDRVTLTNVNIPIAISTVTKVPNTSEFECTTSAEGDWSGEAGVMTLTSKVNLYEDNIVFRFLPSYKLVKFAEVMQVLQSCAPVTGMPPVSLATTTGSRISYPFSVASARLSKRQANGSPFGGELNRQQFDSSGKPLQAFYGVDGKPLKRNLLTHSKTQNSLTFTLQPEVNELWSQDESTNERLYVYDFYGFDLNDPTRGPYYASDIIVFDPSSPDGLRRKLDNNGSPLYKGVIYDKFSNFVTGGAAGSRLKIRVPILPLEVDHFNQPYSAPLKAVNTRGFTPIPSPPPPVPEPTPEPLL